MFPIIRSIYFLNNVLNYLLEYYLSSTRDIYEILKSKTIQTYASLIRTSRYIPCPGYGTINTYGHSLCCGPAGARRR